MAPQYYFALNTINRSNLSIDDITECYHLFRIIGKLGIFTHDYI